MKKIIIANWKMNPTSQKEAEKLFSANSKIISTVKKNQIVICPPFVYLAKFKKYFHTFKKSNLFKASLGAQNLFYQENGPFTGEISGEMLYDLGVRYVILGHSERRLNGETNEEVNKKIKSALRAGLSPIICIGEKERDLNLNYLSYIKEQVENCLKNITKKDLIKIIIAYEPIWAIGKNAISEAKAEEFREIKVFIKKVLSDKFGFEAVSKIKIIYGGSVHPKNALNFLSEGEADGLLIGRDSIDLNKFKEIIKTIEQ